MSLKIPKSQGIDLFKPGGKQLSGIEDAVIRNIQAVNELSEIVRTSFGPNGKNKLIINHLDRLFVTNDAATIVEELEVVHPAAKLIVMASHQQEQEVGDGSNLVLILAGELLKKAENLLIMGLHPSEIVQGYELARNKALESLSDLSNGNLALPPTKQSLATSIKTSLGSKQFGNEDFLADLVSDAVSTVMPKDFSQFNIDNVRVVKIMGGNLYESRVLRGMVFGRQPEGVARNATKAKVAVFTSGIDISQTETKGTVLLKNADEMMNFTRGEEQQIEKVLKEIADSGVKVVVAGSQVGDLALHYLNRLDIVVIKVLSKFELRRLCRVVGATPLARLGAPTAEEAGYVDVLETTEIGGDRVTVFRQDNDQLTRTSTIVLRGATANHLDDIERAIDDGVNIIKTLLTKDNRFIAGAGGSEMELSKIIEDFGDKTPGLNQHAIKKFAEALQIVPITLSDNAGLNSTEILAKLLSAHSTDKGRDFGIDIDAVSDEGIINTLQHGIKDSLASKWWSIKYAVESAIAVLRVDSIIMSKAAGLAPPQQQGHWDDD
ncbi:putative T-complex protein 1 subunit theta [Wallemia ichthyophaga EXF-994]|uniref:CCT-theta n=1 Tax=Wallemia ichthyophaga (strain EXF-994 / CBS 113033) TaxID=1299270 RepID=R9AJW7_WALI9|nr:putative T-complex protein 1 subunit theta [Wallemia ichthyophaga EXF-994]EOR00326.1 putative T-complex protein 1 subunit theta [Wallemia ichthyophaga EXF-994]